MNFKRMTDLDLAGKRVLIREDLNVPVKDGKVTSDARIRASLPTIEHALKAGARVMLMSHLGRPTEGEYAEEFSLQPVADHLGKLLGRDVPLVKDWLDGVDVAEGQVVLCENVRFNKGEKKDDEALSQKMAALCDIYVMDAFGTAHRAQASTHGVGKFAPVACAGPLLANELDALGKALNAPEKPLVAIVGGSKVSTKLEVLTAKEFAESAEATAKKVADVADDDLILDIGPQTAHIVAALMKEARTIIWNGPLGVFEFDQFGEGTKEMAEAIADSDAFSIAGGGDTLAAVDKYGITDRISYISTGGGAFLEFVEGKVLPAVAMLEARAKD